MVRVFRVLLRDAVFFFDPEDLRLFAAPPTFLLERLSVLRFFFVDFLRVFFLRFFVAHFRRFVPPPRFFVELRDFFRRATVPLPAAFRLRVRAAFLAARTRRRRASSLERAVEGRLFFRAPPPA